MRNVAFSYVAIVETITLDVPFAADLSRLEHGSLLGLFPSTESVSVMLVVLELERSVLVFVSNHHFVFLLFLAVSAGCGVCGSVVICHRSFLGGSDHFC
jgi:hypothetical protein